MTLSELEKVLRRSEQSSGLRLLLSDVRVALNEGATKEEVAELLRRAQKWIGFPRTVA